MTLIKDLHWRYATKRMVGKDVAEADLEVILEAVRLAPTSMGMQAFKVFVVKDKELIKRIQQEAAPRQLMIEGCSVLLVFAAYANLNNNIVEDYIQHISKVREVTLDSLSAYKERLKVIAAMPAEANFEWTARQVYIAMAYATVAAASLKIDATPVEGFDNAAMDEVLGLENQNLKSVLLLPLGYRDEENDFLVHQKKVRKNKADLFIEL